MTVNEYQKLALRAADTYAAVILHSLGFTMEDAVKMNIEEMQERYYEGGKQNGSKNKN